VWNDYFDIDQDRRERPFRPIPSGRVPLGAAARLGTALLVLGLLFAALSGWRPNGFHFVPAGIGIVLVAAILLYDGWLKRTGAGPVGMGACRFLNVLLGLTAADAAPPAWGWHLAAVVGLYIIGVTWFARTEARRSKQSTLTAAAVTMLAALLLALAMPTWFEPGTSSVLFPYLLVALGFLVGVPVARAVANPAPDLVQPAVKAAIFGLVILDAVLATAVAGPVGLAILLLLPPAMYLGRRIYST
jgi:4-hydroxybenzoate polyprenyltransferase